MWSVNNYGSVELEIVNENKNININNTPTKTSEIRSRKKVTIKPNTQHVIRIKTQNRFISDVIEDEKKEGRKIDKNYNHKIFLKPSQTLLQTPLRLASGFLGSNHKILISNWSNEKLIIKEKAL